MDKKELISVLVKELMEETGAIVHFCENHSPTCIDEVDILVESLIKLTNINLKRERLNESNKILIKGELDFNAYKYIADKLIENGFNKSNSIVLHERYFDEYIIGRNLFSVMIPKSIL